MAKTYGYRDDKGRVRTTTTNLPRGMRGVDPDYDVRSFTEGPFARLLNRRRR